MGDLYTPTSSRLQWRVGARSRISKDNTKNQPKKILISFADGRLVRSARRFERQAREIGEFDSIKVFSEHELTNDFKKAVGPLLSEATRGFGYWVWKPHIILETLHCLEEDDIVLYADVGCHFLPGGKDRLADYFRIVCESATGILAFQAQPPKVQPVWDGRWLPTFPDAQWSKGDLLDFFDVRERLDIIESPTIGAGILLVRNCETARTIIRSWLEIMVQNPSLIDDSASKSQNHPWFIAHRHDQSVFSIIAKLNDVTFLSAFEYWYPSVRTRKPDWASLSKNPIHARRDLDFGILRNSADYLSKKVAAIWIRASRLNPFARGR